MQKSSFVVRGAVAALAVAGSVAQGEVVLVDLGNDTSYRGASVSSPDVNGNHWNSVWSGAFYTDLVNTSGAGSGINFGFSYAGGTDYYNGPAGDVEDPATAVYNAAALGNLGVDEAVYDYYTTSGFQILNLDQSKTYDITFYGAHKFSADGATKYTAYTDGNFDTEIASAVLEHQDAAMPWLHNEDTTVTLSGLTADADGIVYIGFDGANGVGAGYLNAFSITVVPAPSGLAVLALGGIAARRRR